MKREREREEENRGRGEDFIVRWLQHVSDRRIRTWKCVIVPHTCAVPVPEQGRSRHMRAHTSRYMRVTLGSPSGVACTHICMGAAC